MPRRKVDLQHHKRRTPISMSRTGNQQPVQSAPLQAHDASKEANFDERGDVERELMGEAIYDAEEEEAEEEGEDLLGGDNEFVGGAADAEREARVFMDLGVDPNIYDPDYIDDAQYDGLDPRHRRAVEKMMDYRDYKQSRRQRENIRGNFLENETLRQLLEEDDEETENMRRLEERVQRRRKYQSAAAQVEAPDLSNLENAKGALLIEAKSSIFDERIQEAVDTCFRYFLAEFSLQEIDENNKDDSAFYQNKIEKMLLEESTCLYVNATHLFRFHCENLLKWIEHKPLPVLEVMNDTLAIEVQQHNAELFTKVFKDLSFRTILTDWPYSTNLRSLRSFDLNTLIRISGVITKRGNVLPRLKVMYLTCSICGMTMSEYPIYFHENSKIQLPKNCLNCQGSNFIVNRLRTVYSDFQRLTLQESPGSVPAGRSARQKELIVTSELVDFVKPGDEVEVIGIYKTKYDTGLNYRLGFPVLATEIEVNNIVRKEDIRVDELSLEDISDITKLSKDPHIRERIISSIAPSIWGHKDLKTALAYAMFGGDPSLGKSQALQYIHKTYPRTVFTNGKGASAAGLTACVRRDASTGEWLLEGGALVLADEGICLIDEFDKMTTRDRVSIHEAMEQQTISISKAGINTTLKARCSVIAAANPKHGGRYESSYTFKENVDLSDPILSRFDLIVVMRDIVSDKHQTLLPIELFLQPNIDQDFYLAQYVVTNHQLNHPDLYTTVDYEERIKTLEQSMHGCQAYEPIDQDLLRKYIIYARSCCKPNLDELKDKEILEKLSNFYSKIRQRAAHSGGLPMTPRHIESMIRISEANAKMRLSPRVTSKDIDYAIATLLDSFISSQKFAVANKLSREYARYRALARGGYDMLVEILRRSLQDLVRREALRARKTGEGIQKNIPYYEIDRSGTKLPVELFYKHASQYKYSRYQIDTWFQSDSFKTIFSLSMHGDKRFIHCKTSSLAEAKRMPSPNGADKHSHQTLLSNEEFTDDIIDLVMQ
ncbi:putative Dna replication licensing factor [Cardiosporidium cionae]|uniref:DNA replication licensing factor MCM2 n=1 Tax=Cardiosporidium cionae TaxID=476202 RepID=A0ABQ7J5Y2_9APIC|nr:putative Dna replication licensing factor [Cardiosporidium cionae]|eukprot:KAF8819402.1 putative Dna replication licensing factor [Cardiosporidium cionae]